MTRHGVRRGAIAIPHSLSWCRACALPPTMSGLRELPAPSHVSGTLQHQCSPHFLPIPTRGWGWGSWVSTCWPQALGPGSSWPLHPAGENVTTASLSIHETGWKKYRKRKREGRKGAKIDNGFSLFAFCSLSHGFQFYFTTARAKTSFLKAL